MLKNKLWDQTIENFKIVDENFLFSFTIKQLTNLFNIQIERFYDFLIISYEGDRELGEELEQISYEQFEKFRKATFGSKRNYETSCNEIRITDYLGQQLTLEEQYLLSKQFIQNLNSRLILMTNRKIYYLLSIEDNILTLFFYQEWDDKDTPLNENLNEYNNPIAIFTSDELSNNIINNS